MLRRKGNSVEGKVLPISFWSDLPQVKTSQKRKFHWKYFRNETKIWCQLFCVSSSVETNLNVVALVKLNWWTFSLTNEKTTFLHVKACNYLPSWTKKRLQNFCLELELATKCKYVVDCTSPVIHKFVNCITIFSTLFVFVHKSYLETYEKYLGKETLSIQKNCCTGKFWVSQCFVSFVFLSKSES